MPASSYRCGTAADSWGAAMALLFRVRQGEVIACRRNCLGVEYSY
ncbi:hypothetical protein DOT_1434 [Desulfosporosinus sp. OT]|nr:hypothetical protein DOT_1434 [Desulfosporosinus sp. OT]